MKTERRTNKEKKLKFTRSKYLFIKGTRTITVTITVRRTNNSNNNK